MVAAIIQRWVLLLSAYQCDIHYWNVQQNANADALSCLPSPGQEDNSSAELMEYVLYTRDLDDRILSAEQLAALTTQDNIPWQVKEQIQCGWPLHLATDQQPFLPYFARGNSLR